jgi:hypothetical protein
MTSTGVSDYGTCLARAAATLESGQLVTGEVATYRRIPGAGKLYAPSPFMSSLVHDALGCIDPRSPHVRRGALAGLTPAERRKVEWTVTTVRARIRRFLTWQEEADGTWCFYGRGSALGPDAASTASAALAVSRRARPGGRPRDPWSVHARALARFRAASGSYFTFVSDDGVGYGWIAADGRRLVGFDRVVNAHIMRYLAAAGVEDEALAAYLRAEIAQGDLESGSPEHPDPVSFAHATARAWAESPRTDAGVVQARLVPWLLSRQDERGGFGGPLSTALAALALIDLGYTGEALDRAAAHLLATGSPAGEWEYQAYLAGGHGSASFTSALAISALACCAATRGGVG